MYNKVNKNGDKRRKWVWEEGREKEKDRETREIRVIEIRGWADTFALEGETTRVNDTTRERKERET